MESSSMCENEDYFDKFDPSSYLNYYGGIQFRRHMLRSYHAAFRELPPDVTVLDYGSGPSITGVISAATKASAIFLSDYCAANRDFAQDWLEDKPGAFDWDPHFNYVVKELEGGSDEAVEKRKQEVRKLVKGIAHCDLSQDPPIEKKYNKLYDVVITSYVLESTATSDEEYFSMMSRICNLVKPGGTLLVMVIENTPSYKVGDLLFKGFSVSCDTALKAIRECGLNDLHCDKETLTLLDGETATRMFIHAKLGPNN